MVETTFCVLIEFQCDKSVLFKKKIKLNSCKTGKDLKLLIENEFSESPQLKNHMLYKILIIDPDFDNELVDLDENETFQVNLKVFVEKKMVIVSVKMGRL